ncbi:Uncharacterized protein ABC855_g3068 [[Candida] zeylanoides]
MSGPGTQPHRTADSLADFVPITEVFFSALSRADIHQVVKSKYFDLLEGTRAVEVNNAKLDTAMLRYELTAEEINFNPASPRSPETIVATIDKLYVLLMSWLNNSSLPVTVLSCRYVHTLLVNYTAAAEKSLAHCSLHDRRFGAESASISIESQLVHRVLRTFVIGLAKFIGFVLQVGASVLYEEEDLITRNMDLDFLSSVPTEAVVAELQATVAWVQQQSDFILGAELIPRLELAINLNRIEAVLAINLTILSPTQVQLPYLTSSVTLLQQIGSLSRFESHIPEGAFSKFVQIDLNNKSIPSALYEMDHKVAFEHLVDMFMQLQAVVSGAGRISNHHQLQTFLEFEVANKMDASFNVFVRGLFQLFLIRDNKCVLGSASDDILATMHYMMSNLNTIDSKVFSVSTVATLSHEDKTTIMGKLELLLGDLESVVYHTVSNTTNNRCRQRQLMSRCLLIWDTLQVTSENFELDIWEQFKVGDDIDGVPSLPISSFIYFHKLQSMVGLALRGFELDLYKVFEVPQLYWYVSFLSKLVIEHLQGRIRIQIESKMHEINVAMPKRIKKLKAGDKKESLKRALATKQAVVLPQLHHAHVFNQRYHAQLYQGLQNLCSAVKGIFFLLHRLQILDLLQGPKSNLVSLENIYRLRMKPFSSIGVPALPEFQVYKESVESTGGVDTTQLHQMCSTDLSRAKVAFQKVHEFVSSSDSAHYFTNGCNSHTHWIEGLVKTCISYQIELKKLSSVVGTTNRSWQVGLAQGFHVFFPKLVLIEK